MEVQMFKFPVAVENNLKVIELQFCQLINKYRVGDISPEEKDWMDWANNVLISCTKLRE